MAFKGGGKGAFGKAGGAGGKSDEEDRSKDWYCEKCSERNFMKRAECFKCKSARPKDGGNAAPKVPDTGTTLHGMVKSYNRKGFGFIMCLHGGPACQDIYYSRENLHTSLQTRDIPGEHVTFEIMRFPDGKLVAKDVRPHGLSKEAFSTAPPAPPVVSKGVSKGSARGDEEDRSRDWKCEKCGERNFVKRFECFKCKNRKPPDQADETAVGPRRSFSPHAGARAVREMMLASRAAGGRSRSRKRSSSSSSSSKQKKKQGKSKKKKRSSSSGSSSSKSSKSSKSSAKVADPSAAEEEAGAPTNPAVEAAKAENLEKLIKLQAIEPLPARMKAYRELLRTWHPDKNPDKVEVATAVFQFLQKAKPMLDPK